MKLENGKLVHEKFTSSFNYRGRLFIVDKFDDFWLITESQFLIKERGETLEKVKDKIKKSWDEVHEEYKNF